MDHENVKIVNGEKIPTYLPLDKLSSMMESSDMKIFVIACEALVLNGSYEAYALLRKYIDSRDKYRRRYILSVIYHFSFADELTGELEKAIISQDRILVHTALEVLLNTRIQISDNSIIFALRNGQSYIPRYYYSVINSLSKTEENYQAVLSLYRMNGNNHSNKIVIAENLYCFCNSSNFTELFHF